MSARTACAVLVAAVLAVSACGGSGSPAASSSSAAEPTAAATRWWSDAAATAGSTIDPRRPAAAAALLHGGRADYCSMLRQTVAAGRSVLPGASATDPALLTATSAFVAEVQAVAPPAIAAAWRVLGKALLALVGSRGDLSKARGVDAAAVRKAATAIAADAREQCHVELSR